MALVAVPVLAAEALRNRRSYVQLLLEPPSGDWAATFFEDMAAKRARPTS